MPERPRPAILRLAERLRDDARGSGDAADAIIAELVACAWLLDVRDKRATDGSRRLQNALREFIATADRGGAFRLRPLPSGPEWLDDVRRTAERHFALLQRAKTTSERRRVRELIAAWLTEHVISVVPGVDVAAAEASANLVRKLAAEMPKDAERLARWALIACGVEGTRTNRADAGARQRRRRAKK